MDVNETKINIHSILTYQSNVTKKKTWGKITIWPFRIPGPADSMYAGHLPNLREHDV